MNAHAHVATQAENTAADHRLRHHIVVAHPSPASFCRSIARAYCEAVQSCGQDGYVHDLYSHGFDPVLRSDERPGAGYHLHADVAAELELVRQADVLVLAYPIWFGLPPAMMKGFVDRVLGAGFLPSNLKEQKPSPILEGKRLVVITTSAATRPWLEEKGQYHALRQAFDLYLNDIFGMHGHDRISFDAVVPGSSAEYLGECMAFTRERARTICADELSRYHAAKRQRKLSAKT